MTVRQFENLREQAGDAILLFVDGETVQAYSSDASWLSDYFERETVATQSHPKLGRMATIRRADLDAVVESIVHYGRRVAVCQQLARP